MPGSLLSLEREPSSVERVGEDALSRVIRRPQVILTLYCCVGTQRRAKKATHNTASQEQGEDKKVKAAIKKFGKWDHSSDLHSVFCTGRRAATF